MKLSEGWLDDSDKYCLFAGDGFIEDSTLRTADGTAIYTHRYSPQSGSLFVGGGPLMVNSHLPMIILVWLGRILCCHLAMICYLLYKTGCYH